MSTNFPIKEFRFASQQENQSTNIEEWTDIPGLILDFDAKDAGNFLVTLNIPAIYNVVGENAPDSYVGIRVLLRGGADPAQQLAQVVTAPPSSPLAYTVSFQCEAKIHPTDQGSHIVAQWQAVSGGLFTIEEGTWCTLSAVGSLQPRKVAYTDLNHFEYPQLFSRGLQLTNFTETLIITGYSATPAQTILDITPTQLHSVHLTASAQMQWIVDHLDEFFATIPYADGTGHYSKYDMVYFDLVIDKTVNDKEQTAVLKVLEKWFGPEKSNDLSVPDKLEVIPRPSTGILKKVEALAFSSTKVEIEFILAH